MPSRREKIAERKRFAAELAARDAERAKASAAPSVTLVRARRDDAPVSRPRPARTRGCLWCRGRFVVEWPEQRFCSELCETHGLELGKIVAALGEVEL